MTEKEWKGDNSFGMCEFIGQLREADLRLTQQGLRRKLRLVGAACCRRMVRLFINASQGKMIEVAEQYADGLTTQSMLAEAEQSAAETLQSHHQSTAGPDWQPIDGARILVAQAVCWMGSSEEPFDMGYTLEKLYGATVNDPDDPEEEERHQAIIIRDIFGNPFLPVAFDPEWRSSTAVGVAQRMYDAREFGAMPILADALQDAGCEDAAVLAHCRDPQQVHVRGCWVVDLVLGKQ